MKIFDKMVTMPKTTALTATMLAPVGRLMIKESNMPKTKHMIDDIAETIMVCLNDETSRLAISAGKIIKPAKIAIIVSKNAMVAPAVKRFSDFET